MRFKWKLLSFAVINTRDEHPILLNGIIDELQKIESYKPIFVNDFAPVDKRKRYTYIKWRKGFQLGASCSLNLLDPTLETITMFGKSHHMSVLRMLWWRTKELSG